MIAQVCMYLNTKKSSADPAHLHKILTDIGFTVQVDNTHYESNWFDTQFHNENHRAFYTDPFLMGLVKDIKFQLMGPPDFCVWFNDSAEIDQLNWNCLAAYFNTCLNGGTCPPQTMDKARNFIGTFVVPKCITMSEQVQSGDDVIVRDMKDYYYEFTDLAVPEKDQMFYSVRKPFVTDPFTICIDDFSKVGSRYFFADLFACKEWGTNHCDVEFLKQLWQELEMIGELDIDDLLNERTRQFLPDGNDLPSVEPRVKRQKISELTR